MEELFGKSLLMHLGKESVVVFVHLHVCVSVCVPL